MAITKIQAGALPADVITTAAIDDASITHAKLHTTMDLSSKTVTLPTLSTLNTTGSVGIGTSSPSHNLHVSSSSGSILALTAGSTENAQIRFGDSSDDDAGKINYDNSTNHMALHTNAAERMRIDSSGNVGIGTSSPTRQLSIVDDGTNGQAIMEILDSTNNNVSGIFLGRANNTNIGGVRYFHSTNHLALRSNDVDALIINSSGNVGIGTSDPSTMLHLSAGTTGSQGGSHAGITMTNKYDNPDNSWSIRPSRDGLSNTGLEIRDVTDDRSVMAFDGAGNVGIGTNSPSYKLDVASHIQIRAGESLRLQNVAGSSAATISCDGAGTNSDLSFKTANTERMSIDTSGRVTMPYQPAFFAHRNGGNYTETNATAKVYIDGTRFNHGGHYDTTNNRFVAPVDGAYQFNASVNCYFISPGYQLRAFLFVNGSSYAVGDSFHSANNSHDLVASVSHVIYLSANDYVEVWSYSDDGSRGFSSSAVWNTFSGHLLG